jgi:murein L,D-transpeptidase YcbB/YkuD
MPSKQNELGDVKFLFETKTDQYLHDTPRKELFTYDKRDFSHGCIRLEKPMELADYLLKTCSGYTDNKIAKLKSSYKPDMYIRLQQPMPLLIVYLTAWADEQMQVQFREDVYGYDKALPRLSSE